MTHAHRGFAATVTTAGSIAAATLLFFHVSSPVFADDVKVHDMITIDDSGLPHPPEQLTSFGAAIAGGKLYLYGGHTGTAHTYSIDEQSDGFYRLDLTRDDAAWETLPSGPKLQGLAIVAHGDDIIRVGGFTAMNAADQDQDLQSQASVARFDADANAWVDLPDLPQPRSSIDAVVDGDRLYVVGGWQLSGGMNDVTWHNQAYALDLSKSDSAWTELGESFAARRANSAAIVDGKLIVIGGMLPEGKPTTQVLVYDPETNAWTDGPELPGEGMNGFGTAACVVNGVLYVNTINGYVHRLPVNATTWETIGQVDPPRFFHRMMPRQRAGSDLTDLLLVGGVNMETGKFDAIDAIVLPKSP